MVIVSVLVHAREIIDILWAEEAFQKLKVGGIDPRLVIQWADDYPELGVMLCQDVVDLL